MALTYFANGRRITEGCLCTHGQYQIEIYGNSADEKPTNVPDSSVFLEKDTGKVYLFDVDSKTWMEQ